MSGAYALGLGIPFVVAALWCIDVHWALSIRVRRHQIWVMRLGGMMLVCIGVLLVTGWWSHVVIWLQVHLIVGAESPV